MDAQQARNPSPPEADRHAGSASSVVLCFVCLGILGLSGLLAWSSLYPMEWIGGTAFVYEDFESAVPIPMIVFLVSLVGLTVAGSRWQRRVRRGR